MHALPDHARVRLGYVPDVFFISFGVAGGTNLFYEERRRKGREKNINKRVHPQA